MNFQEFLCPIRVKKELDKFIVGQHETKKVISVAVYNHYKKLFLLENKNLLLDKSNILLVGPTGSGKTLMVKTLAKIINVPILIVDATSFTEAGYVGDDVEMIIQKLLHNCEYNVELAEKSIIYIDEIDKIAKKNDFYSGKDVSGEGVQQSLLKLIEGVNLSINSLIEKKNQQPTVFNINTANILFICGGAFSGIEHITRTRINNELLFIDKKNDNIDVLQYINNDDLISFGLIPEFLGRLPIVTVFRELNIREMVHILIKPKNSILKQICYLFNIEGVIIKFSYGSIKEIAKIAVKQKIGARGLKSIIENILLDTMYSFSCKKNLKIIIIHKDVITKKKKPVYIYK